MTPEPHPRDYCNWEAVHRAMDAMNRQPDARITTSAVAIMLVIVRRINRATGVGMATYDNIIEEARVSHGTVAPTIQVLVDLGLLVRTSGGLPNRANRYRLGPKALDLPAAEKPGNKQPNQQTTSPTTTSRINSLLHYE